MPEDDVELSIIMPCLNEAESLPFCIRKAFQFLEETKINGEVLVADNGSSDNSVLIAKQLNARVIVEPNKGYGSAILAGVNSARGKYLVIGDADDSYDFSSIHPFILLLRNGSDLVIGNRFKGGIKKDAMPVLHRYLGNPVLSAVGRVFFKISIGDFHCGLRAIRKDSLLQLDLKTTGMEFASEMIVKASLSKMKIDETPVILYPDKRNRASHLRTWQDGWRHLRFLLLYSPRWLFLLPGLLLTIIGLIGTIALMFGPVEIARARLDIHSLVYTSAIIPIGTQLISFYLFSKLYASIHDLNPYNSSFLKKFNRYFSLERGIFAGILSILIGIVLLIKSVNYWRYVNFGDINAAVVLRWVVPSAVLISLGFQLIISHFYLSFLLIKRKNSGTSV